MSFGNIRWLNHRVQLYSQHTTHNHKVHLNIITESFPHALRATTPKHYLAGSLITNEAILATTELTPLQDIVSTRRASLFAHVARLPIAIPIPIS